MLILFAGFTEHIFYTIASLESDAELIQFALAIPGVRELVNLPQRAGTRQWAIQYTFFRLAAWL